MKNRLNVGSTHVFVGVRLLISMGLLLLARMVFILFNHSLLDPDLSFTGFLWLLLTGLRYDFSALMMINGLWIALVTLPFPFRNSNVFRFLTGWLFYLPNIVALTLNMIDVAYFRFTLSRTTGDVLNFLVRNKGMDISLIPDFLMSYWYLVLIWGLLCWAFIRFSVVVGVDSKLTFHRKGAFIVWNLPVYLFWIALTVIGIRGGFQLKPVSLVNAATVVPAREIPAVLNTPFVMVKTIKTERLPEKKYMPAEEALKLFNPDQSVRADSIAGLYSGYNLMVIMMESFSLEHMAAGGEKSFTPFLDSLAGESLFYKAYANGKRSIEAIPAVLASLPTWMNYDFISSPYAANQINSLASLLKPLGYRSLFFHGGTNGTMSFDAFCRLAGFDEYYGRTEYANDADFDGRWGIWDEKFFGYTASVLSRTPKPFIAGLFSLSSHHPYRIPEKYAGRFPEGKLPIQRAIAYADYSLKRFFEQVSHEPWFDKTIFVITADHTSESTGGYFATRAGQYTVPVLFYCHTGLPPAMKGVVAQQTDIMPTLLHLVGFKGKFVAFGSSLYDTLAPRFAMNHAEGSYQFFMDEYVMHYTGDEITACFDLKNDSMQTANLAARRPSGTEKAVKLMEAVIQQYNERMNENRLTP